MLTIPGKPVPPSRIIFRVAAIGHVEDRRTREEIILGAKVNAPALDAGVDAVGIRRRDGQFACIAAGETS